MRTFKIYSPEAFKYTTILLTKVAMLYITSPGLTFLTTGSLHLLTTFLLHHIFKVQGLSVSRQQIEACLQTVVECNPWFPDEGSFDLEIWHWAKENVERAARQGKNIQ
jgi:hypothetical protein